MGRPRIKPTGRELLEKLSKLRLPEQRRFFARLRSFDLECPFCTAVHLIGLKNSKVWSARTCRFKCTKCKHVFTLGIVAWPTGAGPTGGNARPPDAVPTPEQAIELRQAVGGWWLPTSRHYRDPANLNFKTGCTCTGLGYSDRSQEECRVHSKTPFPQTSGWAESKKKQDAIGLGLGTKLGEKRARRAMKEAVEEEALGMDGLEGEAPNLRRDPNEDDEGPPY